MKNKRSDIDFVAMAIVNHVCETHAISVEERQKHNDALMDYAYGKIMAVDIWARTHWRAHAAVHFEGPYNDAKDDAQAYCSICDEDLSKGDVDWVLCPRCGVRIIWPGDADERD